MQILRTTFCAVVFCCLFPLFAAQNSSGKKPQQILAKKRLKILIYSPTLGWSHMQFLGAVADALVEAGHDVHFFRVLMNKRAEALPTEVSNVTNVHNYLPKCFEKGDKFDINEIDEFKTAFDGKGFYTFLFQSNMMDQFCQIKREICRELTNDLQLIRRLEAEHFDVALAEMVSLCPMAIFHRIGVKTKLGTLPLALFQGTARNFGIPSISSYVPTLLAPVNGGSKMNFWERFVNLVNDFYEWVHLSNLPVSYEAPVVAEAFGKNFPPLKEIARNVSLLFINSNQFFEMPRPISNKVINVGGLVEMKAKELEPRIKSVVDNSREGVVIISFGTFANVNSMKTEMKLAFLDAFARFPDHEFIWKIELSDEDAKLFAKFKNVHAVKWIDQKSLLMHSKTRAFVSHCGFNSVNEAVQSGVPILAIPLLGDQLYNAILAREKGVAVQLDVGQLNGEGAAQLIRDGLDKVLNDPSYGQNAKVLKRKFALSPFGAKQKLVKWVEFAAQFGDLNELNLPWEETLGFLAYYSVDVILFTVFLMGALAWLFFKLAQFVAKCLMAGGIGGERKMKIT